MIYLDNAATTIHKPVEMSKAFLESLTQGNAGRGLSDSSLDAARRIFLTRMKLAEFFDAEVNRTIFTMNASHSLNIAIMGLLSEEDRVLTSCLEHNSVLRPLYALEEKGMKLDVFTPQGKSITKEDVERHLCKDTSAVVLTHASNVIGGLSEIGEIGRLCKKKGLLFIVDASQTAGVFPVSVKEDHISALCFTGHKALMGPQGTGGLCLGEGVNPKPLLRGGTGVHSYDKDMPPSFPDRLEAGTLNGHGIAGLGGSLDYILREGIDTLRKKEQHLAGLFYDGVKDMDGITIYSEDPRSGVAIVTLNVRDEDSGVISDKLMHDYGIATRPGAHCAPLVHKMLGTVEQGAVRFSFCHNNTEEDVQAALNALKNFL